MRIGNFGLARAVAAMGTLTPSPSAFAIGLLITHETCGETLREHNPESRR
jgi:hypothetical protein